MKFNKEIPVFGDSSFRGDCKKEDLEAMDFYSWLKFNHPEHAEFYIHPKAEGKRTYAQVNYEKKTGGIPTSTPDGLMMHAIPFCVELKRKDHTKSKWQDGQEDKLIGLSKRGCFVGVALGADGMKEAFTKWLEIISRQ